MSPSPLAALARARAFSNLLTVAAEQPEDHAAQAIMAQAVLETEQPETLVMAPVVGGVEVNGLPADVPVVAPLLQRAGILELGLGAEITVAQLCEVASLLAHVTTEGADRGTVEAGFRAMDAGTVQVRFRPRTVRPTAVVDRVPESTPIEFPPDPAPELAAILLQLEAIATLEPPDDELEWDAISRLTPIIDLAAKYGRDDEMLDGLCALLVLEREAQRDPRQAARRQAITQAVRKLTADPLLRRVAELRIAPDGAPARARVAQAILHRFKDDAVRVMLGCWASAATPAVQDAMLEAMRPLPRLYEALEARIRGADDLEARAAIQVLAELGNARAEEVLREQTRHPNEKVRRAAIAALARFSSELALVALVAAVSDDIPAVRLCAIQASGRPRASMAVPRIAAVLEKDRHAEVLSAAVTALGTIATGEAVALLERLALGKVRGVVASTPTLRIDACRALLAIRSPAAMVALQHVAAEADRKVKSAALQLLAAAARRGTTATPTARS